MDNQFIYCPKCSTRNFADDEICGVCKTKLSSQTSNQPIKKATVEKPTNWKALSTIIGAVIIFYFAFIKTMEQVIIITLQVHHRLRIIMSQIKVRDIM